MSNSWPTRRSNETRFCGVTQFKRYGEFADPELSNLRIHTIGFGFRPAASVFIDLVYQRYRLNQIANEFRSSGITAEMNNVEGRIDQQRRGAFFGRKEVAVRQLRDGLFLDSQLLLEGELEVHIQPIRRAHVACVYP